MYKVNKLSQTTAVNGTFIEHAEVLDDNGVQIGVLQTICVGPSAVKATIHAGGTLVPGHDPMWLVRTSRVNASPAFAKMVVFQGMLAAGPWDADSEPGRALGRQRKAAWDAHVAAVGQAQAVLDFWLYQDAIADADHLSAFKSAVDPDGNARPSQG